MDYNKIKNDCVKWIRDWFNENGPDCNAVIGISGGKDSSVVAALCVEALGKDKVIGVLMPNGIQKDIDVAKKLVNYLGIKNIIVDISSAVEGTIKSIKNGMVLSDSEVDNPLGNIDISEQTVINLPARIRMSTLYAVSQSCNGRVSNNCNLSEDWVGYSTRYGDSAGDFSPLSNLTVTEVKEIGKLLLPDEFVEKIPTDGLCGKTDEENLGFTYDVLDKYIRTGEIDDKEIKEKIDSMHKKNLYKLKLMPAFNPQFN